MKSLLSLLLLCCSPGSHSFQRVAKPRRINTADTNQPAATGQEKAVGDSNMPDQNGDVAFQAFLSRLRQAIRAHDVDTIASMMTTDFGYRIEPLGEGKGVFEYWDQNNVWPELELIMKERFVPNGDKYMVAPGGVRHEPRPTTRVSRRPPAGKRQLEVRLLRDRLADCRPRQLSPASNGTAAQGWSTESIACRTPLLASMSLPRILASSTSMVLPSVEVSTSISVPSRVLTSSAFANSAAVNFAVGDVVGKQFDQFGLVFRLQQSRRACRSASWRKPCRSVRKP